MLLYTSIIWAMTTASQRRVTNNSQVMYIACCTCRDAASFPNELILQKQPIAKEEEKRGKMTEGRHSNEEVSVDIHSNGVLDEATGMCARMLFVRCPTRISFRFVCVGECVHLRSMER